KADANGDGERAIAAAERLAALEPTREDLEQDSPNREQAPAQSVVKLVPLPEPMPRSLPVPETAPLIPVPISQQFWRRQPLAAAGAIVAFLAIGTIAMLGLASAPKLPQLADLRQSQGVVVLPFAVDNASQSDDPAFARVLPHDLIGYLSRFGKLR